MLIVILPIQNDPDGAGLKPLLQMQRYDPIVLMHCPLRHKSGMVSHSFTSKKWNFIVDFSGGIFIYYLVHLLRNRFRDKALGIGVNSVWGRDRNLDPKQRPLNSSNRRM